MEHDITPEQYHAALDILWKAMPDLKGPQEESVWILAANRIMKLEKEIKELEKEVKYYEKELYGASKEIGLVDPVAYLRPGSSVQDMD